MSFTTIPAIEMLTTPDGIANPYPLYDELRQPSPVAG